MSALKRASATLAAFLALFLMWTTSADERSFMLTPDPGFVLVDLRYHGGQTGMNSAYTLYADGRLVAKRVHHLRGVVEEVEHQVEADELDAFLQRLVDAGLYESSQELLEERMGPKRRVFGASDSTFMHVNVALQAYQTGAESELEEVRVFLTLRHPFLLARSFEDVAEIQCLEYLARWFRQYRPAAGRK